MRQCGHCGKAISHRTRRAIFCSRSCKQKANWVRNRKALQESAHRYYVAHSDEIKVAARLWNAAHPEYHHRRDSTNPSIQLGGERFRMNDLPPEAQEVALLIKQLRAITKPSRAEETSRNGNNDENRAEDAHAG